MVWFSLAQQSHKILDGFLVQNNPKILDGFLLQNNSKILDGFLFQNNPKILDGFLLQNNPKILDGNETELDFGDCFGQRNPILLQNVIKLILIFGSF